MAKKQKYIFIFSFLIISLFVCLFLFMETIYLPFFSTSRSNSVEIKSSNINNAYNNTKANDMSDLTQVNDKLYFNYYNEANINGGTYEIASGTEKRISSKKLILDNTLDGKLLDLYSNPFKYYDSNSGQFINYSEISIPDSMKSYDAFVYNDSLFFISPNSLYQYNDGNPQLLVESDDLNLDSYTLCFENIYLYKNYMYYQNYVNKERCICRFDLKTRTVIDEFPINSNFDIDTFFADDEAIYLVADSNSLYKINLSKKYLENVFQCAGTLTANYFNEKLYIGVQRDDDKGGLYILDEQGNISKISDEEAHGVYILDDEYVYYCNRDFNLYRIKIDGKKTEKVFG